MRVEEQLQVLVQVQVQVHARAQSHLLSVVHGHGDAGTLVVEHAEGLLLALGTVSSHLAAAAAAVAGAVAVAVPSGRRE